MRMELEGAEHLFVFDGDHGIAGREQRGGLGEGFGRHHAGQPGRAGVRGVVIEEGLAVGVERGLEFQAAEELGGYRLARQQVRRVELLDANCAALSTSRPPLGSRSSIQAPRRPATSTSPRVAP